MSEALRRLGEVSKTYERLVQTYGQVCEDAAVSEAEHRRLKARFIVTARADGVKSITEAEHMADADEAVAGAHLARLLADGAKEAARSRLTQLREQIATGRTVAVDEREADKAHAAGYGGAA